VRGDLAIKVLTCTELDQNMVNTIAEEIELSALFSMNCPNIVQCKGYSISPPRIYIVMALCDKGALVEVLQGTLSKEQRLSLVSETLGGVAHLHTLNFVHR